MNIFAVSPNHHMCARALDDKRLRKMLLETAQILCTTLNLASDNPDFAPYRSTHQSHPIIEWTSAKGSANFYWLLRLGEAYSRECHYRFGTGYAATEVIEWVRCYYALSLQSARIRNKEDYEDPSEPREFFNGARHRGLGLDFTHLPVHKAYRAYLNARWPGDKRKPVWTRRNPPTWCTYSHP